ncbi:aminoglycoside phosphotransferase family protein [Actinoplanes sp. NPDC051633]|uniref:aminoglycoside phosphotransferase family protein n=1 Tax=Actinoplanes sp. NPDC051633 TaxID=3155670 RepID=UPI0034465D73
MIPAVGVRIGWLDLPSHVQEAVAEILGSPVLEAESQSGGFSPGTADRVVTASGDRAFVKAVSPDQNPVSAGMAREEAVVAAALPRDAPAPTLLGTVDDGHWIALVFEDVDGRHPRTPWVEAELDAAVRGLTKLAHRLTPSPLPGLTTASQRLARDFDGWSRIAADPPADLEPWLIPHLDELVTRSTRALDSLSGDTLVHCDVRADNMLYTPAGEMVFVDWPWGCNGPAWLDISLLAMNVLVHGGDVDDLLPAEGVDVVIAFTGYLLDRSRDAPPPGLPTVRAFQRWQGDALLPWMRSRLTG